MATEELHINGQNFTAVRTAASSVSYSRDYITRLAREQKVKAVSVGRTWYVSLDSLQQYAELQELEAAARRHQLKLQRQMEHRTRERLHGTRDSVAVWKIVVYPVSLALLIISIGFVSGAQLSESVASIYTSNAASVIGATGLQDSAAVSDAVITPVFTEDEQRTYVDKDRYVTVPDTGKDWLTVRYD